MMIVIIIFFLNTHCFFFFEKLLSRTIAITESRKAAIQTWLGWDLTTHLRFKKRSSGAAVMDTIDGLVWRQLGLVEPR